MSRSPGHFRSLWRPWPSDKIILFIYLFIIVVVVVLSYIKYGLGFLCFILVGFFLKQNEKGVEAQYVSIGQGVSWDILGRVLPYKIKVLTVI